MKLNGEETLHVLIIDDSFDDASLIVISLGRYFKLVWQRVDSEANLIIAMDSEWDVVLCDYRMPQMSFEKALEIVKNKDAELPFIVVSGYAREGDVVALFKKGVHDFVDKDDLIMYKGELKPRLPFAIRREVARYRERKNEQKRYGIILREAYEKTIEAWGKALEIRDQYSQGHTVRVADLSLRLAVHMSISHSDFVNLNRGALLHDIGKMAIPDAILLKQDFLTSEEMEVMKQHPVIAYKMLKEVSFLEEALDIPHYHHERLDGSGYPEGLRGEDIPFLARLFAVVDVFDALTTDRPYRPSWEKSKAIAYLLDEKGRTFDEKVVDAFVDMVGRG
jgi:putative nucleotidyltransferase with HDIG domain